MKRMHNSNSNIDKIKLYTAVIFLVPRKRNFWEYFNNRFKPFKKRVIVNNFGIFRELYTCIVFKIAFKYESELLLFDCIILWWSLSWISYLSLIFVTDELHVILIAILCTNSWHFPPCHRPLRLSANSFICATSNGSVNFYPIPL